MINWPLKEHFLEVTKGRLNLKPVSGSTLRLVSNVAFFPSSATSGLTKQGILAKEIIGYRGGYNSLSYDGFVISFEMENYPGMSITTKYPIFSLMDSVTGGGPYGIRLTYSYPDGLIFDYLPTYTTAVSYAMDVIPAAGGGILVGDGILVGGDGDSGGIVVGGTPASYYPNRKHKIQLELRTVGDSSTYVRLFVDGILKASSTIGAAFSLNTSSNFNFYIGYDETSSSGYIGKISNFKIYKTKVDLSAPLTFPDTKGKARFQYFNMSNPVIITGSVIATQNQSIPLSTYGTTLTTVIASDTLFVNGGLPSANFGTPYTLYTLGAAVYTKSAPLSITSGGVSFPFTLFLAGSKNLAINTTPLIVAGSTNQSLSKYIPLSMSGGNKPYAYPLTIVNNDKNTSKNTFLLFIKGSNKQYVTSKPLFIKNSVQTFSGFKPMFIAGNGVFNGATKFNWGNILFISGDNGASFSAPLFISSPYNYNGIGKPLVITGLPLVFKSVNLSIPKVKLQPTLVPLFINGF